MSVESDLAIIKKGLSLLLCEDRDRKIKEIVPIEVAGVNGEGYVGVFNLNQKSINRERNKISSEYDPIITELNS